jgi:uncharacterized protein YqgC (DUF456 family)
MAKKRTIGLALLIGGIIVLIISVAADAIGGSPGFGYKQMAGTVAGAIAAIIGAILMWRK